MDQYSEIFPMKSSKWKVPNRKKYIISHKSEPLYFTLYIETSILLQVTP